MTLWTKSYVHLPLEPEPGYRIEWDYIMENQVSDVERGLGTSGDFTLEQAIQNGVLIAEGDFFGQDTLAERDRLN